jgi:anaerobic ribonucleoside-triphosphate reductase activating protein
MLNIVYIEPESYIYAPGKQFVIWAHGCTIRCKGCWNSEMWDSKPKKMFTVNSIIGQIATIKGLSGVTFLGGEPLDQKEPLLELCRSIKNLGLGITIYTGYEKEELNSEICKNIMGLTDILICGRYIESLRDTGLQWRGSSNQKILFLTEYYANYQIDNANYCEINISENGEVRVLGFPDLKLVGQLRGIFD